MANKKRKTLHRRYNSRVLLVVRMNAPRLGLITTRIAVITNVLPHLQMLGLGRCEHAPRTNLLLSWSAFNFQGTRARASYVKILDLRDDLRDAL
jgi:hypothetical protein